MLNGSEVTGSDKTAQLRVLAVMLKVSLWLLSETGRSQYPTGKKSRQMVPVRDQAKEQM